MKTNNIFFDSSFEEKEQLLRRFKVIFDSIKIGATFKTKVSINDIQCGDVIDDNSLESDGYRFHDVFHYTFASLLGWSPCTRAIMKRKRKSVPSIDQLEDGARAAITEEAISLIIFSKAKQKKFFKYETNISDSLLTQIKEMTAPFEVAVRSKEDWQNAILTGYSLFRDLVKNNGGKIHFDMFQKTAIYENMEIHDSIMIV